MIISHNLAALNTLNKLKTNNNKLSKKLEKLSSGLRINRAADDAAGLAISEKMRAQIRGLEQAKRNIQDGISLIQTAEGALGTIHDILQRMNELAVQAANGTYTDGDRSRIQEEFKELKKEIDNIAKNTEFNGIKLLDGSLSGKTKITGSYIGVWVFERNPIQGEIWAVDVFPYHATFEFGATEFNWIPTGIKSNLKETLLELRTNFYKLKNYEIIYGSGGANAFVQNMELYVYGNTVVVTSTTDFDITGDQYLKEAKYLTGNPATYEVKKENTLNIQAGPNPDQFIPISIDDVQTAALQIDDIILTTQKNAQDSLMKIDQAINYISQERSKLGAYQNRLENTMNDVSIYAENLTAAESRIRDADMAKAMMGMIRQNILTQASQAMLAQANQLPNGVLNLIK